MYIFLEYEIVNVYCLYFICFLLGDINNNILVIYYIVWEFYFWKLIICCKINWYIISV